jgi:hypothetical protein
MPIAAPSIRMATSAIRLIQNRTLVSTARNCTEMPPSSRLHRSDCGDAASTSGAGPDSVILSLNS